MNEEAKNTIEPGITESETENESEINPETEYLQKYSQALQELKNLGLKLSENLKIAGPDDEATYHAALAEGLGHAAMKLETDEEPFYLAFWANNDIGFISRTVRPNAGRLAEKTKHDDGTEGTVSEDVEHWLKQITGEDFNEENTARFMIAGIARTQKSETGLYDPMQMIRFLMLTQIAIQENKDMLVSSTARTVNDLGKNSSLSKLVDFCSDYLPDILTATKVLSDLDRSTPTKLWALYIPKYNLELIRAALIKMFNDMYATTLSERYLAQEKAA